MTDPIATIVDDALGIRDDIEQDILTMCDDISPMNILSGAPTPRRASPLTRLRGRRARARKSLTGPLRQLRIPTPSQLLPPGMRRIVPPFLRQSDEFDDEFDEFETEFDDEFDDEFDEFDAEFDDEFDEFETEFDDEFDDEFEEFDADVGEELISIGV